MLFLTGSNTPPFATPTTSAFYNRVGYVDVTRLTEKVTADLDIARNWKPGTLTDDGKRSGTEKGFRQ